MQTINLIQGTPEWHAHRANHFNASDAPAMLGESPYKTRSQLLHETSTGITPEVGEQLQRIFDQGHRFEALARPMAVNICETELYPCVGVEGNLSASFDGIDMLETVCFEHKTLNKTLKACANVDQLPMMYKIQMEQQLMVSGADKCLFIASKWDEEDNLIDNVKFWYKSNPALAQRIADGWVQFEKDLANYKVVDVIEVQKVSLIELPTVNVQARGELVLSNIDTVTPQFDAFLANAITDFETDDDFALGQAQSKIARETAKQCLAVNEQIVAQMQSIGQVTRTMKLYAEKFNAMGLAQEKAVDGQKEVKKSAAKSERQRQYDAHIEALNNELVPVFLDLPIGDKPNFIGAMKNQRTLKSLYEKLDTELARAKIAADSAARLIRENINALDELAADYKFLFNDLQSVITKPADDFKNLVLMRVEAHQKAEAERLAAEREAIREQEQAKAQAEFEAKAKELADAQAREIAAQSKAEESAHQEQSDKTNEAEPAPLFALKPKSKEVEQAATTSEPTLTLGAINERLGFTVSGQFLSELGFEAETAGKFKKYHEHQFKPMCAAIVAHIQKI